MNSQLLQTTFVRIAAVFLMIVVGIVARRRNLLDPESTRRLAVILTNLFYPALIYSALVTSFTLADLWRNLCLPAGAFLVIALGFALAYVAARGLSFPDARQRRAFRFQCAVSNYAFLPMPLALLFWGQPGVANLIFSTVGSELAVWTLGVMAISHHRLDRHSLRHLANVPTAAIAAAIATLALGQLLDGHSGLAWLRAGLAAEVRTALLSTLDIFGKATIPAAMLVAGSHMAVLKWDHLAGRPQTAVVLLRLVLVPAVIIGLLALLPLPVMATRVLTLVAVMPCAVASVAIGEIYEADNAFMASCVLLTHLVSLVSIPLWLTLVVQH
jgi:predicted permease